MQWWKWVGLAGVAGVAARGAIVAREKRQGSEYSTDEVRSRLHERAEDALVAEEAANPDPA